MLPRIAIPVLHSRKPEYAQRSLPQYTRAIEQAGGQPLVIPLDIEPEEVAKRLTRCDAVLLPGSAADVNPSKYNAPRQEKTEDPDPLRDKVDELLLQDAYNLRKPILGICYGMQMLNVYRTGTLVQEIESRVNHAAGSKVPRAHTVETDPTSRLAAIVAEARRQALPLCGDFSALRLEVNSSHHQAAEVVGDGLRIVARCTEDGTIEALEGTSPEHFVLGVQWHPERSYEEDPASRAIFRALVEAARQRRLERMASADVTEETEVL